MPDLFLISVSKTFLFIGRGLCFDGVEFHWSRGWVGGYKQVLSTCPLVPGNREALNPVFLLPVGV